MIDAEVAEIYERVFDSRPRNTWTWRIRFQLFEKVSGDIDFVVQKGSGFTLWDGRSEKGETK